MNQLVGRRFTVGEGEYKIVDALRIGGDTMVYAEQIGAERPKTTKNDARRVRARRAAFHFDDIADFLIGESGSSSA